jgi:TRAP-type transport system small permease protein
MKGSERSDNAEVDEIPSRSFGVTENMDRVLKAVGNAFNWVATAALLGMFAVITIDILSSKILNRPIMATVDIASLLAAVVISFAVSQTILAGRHIEVEFIVNCLPDRIRKGFNVFASVLSFLFFLLIAWRCLVYARELQILGEASLTQRIPVAPFVYGVGIACIPAVVIYAVQIYRDVRKVR